MKTAFVALFVVLAIFACGSSANDCLRPCPANYDPICCGTAAPSSEPQYTFGNTCALDQWNCENNKNYVVKYEGECV